MDSVKTSRFLGLVAAAQQVRWEIEMEKCRPNPTRSKIRLLLNHYGRIMKELQSL